MAEVKGMLAVPPQVELLAETCTFVGAVTVRLPDPPVRFAPVMLKLTEAPAAPEVVAVKVVVPPGTVTLAGGAFSVPETACVTAALRPPPLIDTFPEMVPTVPVPARRT